MLAKNINNEFLYAGYLNNCIKKTPFLEISEALDFSGITRKKCINDIWIINNDQILDGNYISSSFVTGGLLGTHHINGELKSTGKYSIFSDFYYPNIIRKRFSVKHKNEAGVFFRSLVKLGTVDISPSNSWDLNAVHCVDNFDKFEEVWNEFKKKYSYITIENSVKGDIFKIFIHDDKVIGIYGIAPSFVVGDGKATVKELLDLLIIERKNNILYCHYPLHNFKKNIDFSKVPLRGEIVQLKDSLNINYGAVYIDLTEKLGDKFNDLAKKVKSKLKQVSYLEITCFSEDIEAGLEDNSFIVGVVKQNKADLRHFLSCINIKDDVLGFISKIFPLQKNNNEYGIINTESYVNNHFKYSHLFYILQEAAYQLGLKTKELDELNQIIENPKTGQKVLFQSGISQYTTSTARMLTSDKEVTKKILQSVGVRTPQGALFNIDEMETAWEISKKYCESQNGSLVVKPFNGFKARGVSTDISNYREFVMAWSICIEFGYKKIIVEEQLKGEEYRIVVIQNDVCAASQRVPAFVVGDGVSSISELINEKNLVRKKNPFFGKYLIKITKQIKVFLSKSNLTIDSIPLKNERIKLTNIVNAGAGGEVIDRLNDIHPEWIDISIKAKKAVANPYHAGLDIIMEDISLSPFEQEWAVIEINTNPGFGIQLFPTEGIPRNIGKVYLESIFGNIDINKKSYKLIVLGKVQGVGFRKWFKSICDFRSVMGYVKNHEESDRLDVLIIGPETVLEEIIKLSYVGPELSQVRTIICDREIKDVEADHNAFIIKT